MCIMEVREGQHTATIMQACCHNASTLDRDLEMYVSLTRKRGDDAARKAAAEAQQMVHRAYEILLAGFEAEVLTEVRDLPHSHGEERAVIEAAKDDVIKKVVHEVAVHDAQLARRFETR